MSLGTSLKDDALSKAKYKSQVFGVGHTEEEFDLARGCGEQRINVKRVASMLVGLGTRPVPYGARFRVEGRGGSRRACGWILCVGLRLNVQIHGHFLSALLLVDGIV